MQTEEELDEVALLRYAQQRAAKWGADRFAAEFARRDLEERWLEAARANTTPHSPGREDRRAPTATNGPVDASAQDHAISFGRDAWVLSRPEFARHPSVPRPPAAEPEAGRGRRRRPRRERPAKGRGFVISPAEAARMSAAGRRLYGLDDPAS